MAKYRKRIIDVFGTTDAPGDSISPRGTMPNIEKDLKDEEFVARVTEDFKLAAKEERNRMCLILDPNDPTTDDLHMTIGDRTSVGIMRKAIKGELDGCIAMTSRTRDEKHERSLCCGTFQVSDFQNMVQFGLSEMTMISNQALVDEGYYHFRRNGATDEQMSDFVDYLFDHRGEIDAMLKEVAEDFVQQDYEERIKKGLSKKNRSYYTSKERYNQSLTRQWDAFHNYVANLSDKFGFSYEHVPASPEAKQRQIDAFKQRSEQHVDSDASIKIRQQNKAKESRGSIYGDKRLDNANIAQMISILSHPRVSEDLLLTAFKNDPRDDVRVVALKNRNFPQDEYLKYAIRDWNSRSPAEKSGILSDKRAGKLKMQHIIDALDDPAHGLDYALSLTGCDWKRGLDSMLLVKAAQIGRENGNMGCTRQAVLNRDLKEEDRSELLEIFKLAMTPDKLDEYEDLEKELERRRAHWANVS